MLEGTLNKWTNVMKGWQYRWFVLDENAGLLSYYTVSVVGARAALAPLICMMKSPVVDCPQ